MVVMHLNNVNYKTAVLSMCIQTETIAPHSGNFRGRKHSQIDGKKIFAEKTFVDCSLVPPKDAMPSNFRKNFHSHKTVKLAKVFSMNVFCYTVSEQCEASPGYTYGI